MKTRTIKYTMPDGSIIERPSRKILYKIFEKEFKPQINHIVNDPESAFDGCLYETYGEEIDYILSLVNDPSERNRVWTIVEDSSGKWYIVAGYHLINRIGYLVTEKAREEGIEYEDIFYM